MIKIDPRNNSAFNHRHFVVEMTTGFTEEAIKREIKYFFKLIFNFLNKQQNNQSIK